MGVRAVSDVWQSFWNGAEMGGHYGDMRRNREAFQSGGYDGVEQAAANVGDMQTAMTTRRFQDDRTQNAYQRMEQIRPLALGALDRVSQLPVEQRLQFLNQPHIRQRFIDWGITPEQYDQASQQIANPETGAEALASYRAAFSQHNDPNWTLATVPTENGQGVEQRMIAADPTTGAIQRGEGSIPVPRGEVQSFGSGGLYRENPNAPNGIEIIREPRSVAASGGGARAPSGYRWTADGTLEPIPGGPARDPMLAGAEQRGRLVLTFPNIIQAQEDLASLETNAVRRQGTHGSDTPLGQDWLARMAEAVPFDGGSAARMIGGEDYQAYETASRTFEQSVMPIFSGSAVTESEAVRFVRSNLPRMGDDRATLQRKAQNRARIINAAATILGEQPPYPEAGTWTPRGGLQRPQGEPGSPGAPERGNAPEEWVRDAQGNLVPARR